MRRLAELEARWPERDSLFHLKQLGVCPEGLIEADTRTEYLAPEHMCETYKIPPVAGGLEDWPARIYDAFQVIRATHQQAANEKQAELIARVNERTKGRN